MATFDATLPPFDLSTALILITGGSSGIGLALVDAFTSQGAKVLITGRREAELTKVQSKFGSDKVLKTYTGSTGSEQDRIALFQNATKDFPHLNVLINNAGVQRRGDMAEEGKQPWAQRQEELDINLSGPIHLTSLFIPFFLAQGKGKPTAIIQVTSGLAFIPFVQGPVYSATKAALHQWTLAMRPLLAETNVRLVELIPPAVKSNLGGSHDFGEDPDEFAQHCVSEFKAGKLEFGFKFSDAARTVDRKKQAEMMLKLMHDTKVKPFTN